MTTMVIDGVVRINARPFIELLHRKHGKDKPFEQIVSEVQQGVINFEPGDFASCVAHGNLLKAKIGLNRIEECLTEYLSQCADAQLIYDEISLQNASASGEESCIVRTEETYDFETLGETRIVQLEEPTLIFPNGQLFPINRQGNSFVTMRGYNPSSDGGGRLEITHTGGFDRTLELKIPTHVQFDEDDIRPAIFNCPIKLPPKPKKKLTKLEGTIENGKPAKIDIGKLGLHVPHMDSTFSVNIVYTKADINSYSSHPRLINGLFIDPKEKGKILEVRPASSLKEGKRIILTHLYDANDRIVPVKLTINIK